MFAVVCVQFHINNGRIVLLSQAYRREATTTTTPTTANKAELKEKKKILMDFQNMTIYGVRYQNIGWGSENGLPFKIRMALAANSCMEFNATLEREGARE